MKWLTKYILLLLICSSYFGYGQISPGDLTKAHAKFEGMSNCTLCHDLGKKVTNNKCLDCHKDMQTLIKQERGYHVSSDVKNKNCVTCHSEHYGRKFKMIRLDKDKFNHDLAGYKLEGKHDEIDCRKCHKPDFIKDKEIKKRLNTFIGLDSKCLTCHDDYHQKTLSSNDCASCHDTKSFSPAVNFDHNKTDFKLIGKHETVDCKKCHSVVKKNGKDFQNFNHIKFNDCNTCHTSPHEESITGSCKQCHTEISFKRFNGQGRFNHNTTNFSLKGEHKKVDCFSCHSKNPDPKLVFQDKIGIDESSCIKCHEDKHEGKFGNDCAKCHDEKAFVSLKTLEFFDHKLTDFPLEGLHQKVDCAKCHDSGKYIKPIEYKSCNTCHDDYHEGEFVVNGTATDCKTCHSVKQGFDLSLFSTEQHQKTDFPLKGAHNATPCFACHKSDPEQKRWTFRNIGESCADCHQDTHKDYISPKYYPNQKCESCHNNDTWSDVTFDHTKTNWPLKGKHLTTDCRKCHIKNNTKEKPFNQQFANLNSECSTCHTDNHNNQFAINGVTDCTRCHVFKNWIPEKFDHNTTAFKLEGRHAEVACNKCHKVLDGTDKSNINYKIKQFACIDCHR
jgi:hypothetical protein